MLETPKTAVFVPANPMVPIARIVAPGSAIVGKCGSEEAEQVTVDFEGNINGAANIITFADRARHASGRQRVCYPTRARCTVPRSELLQVGWFDEARGIMLLNDEQAKGALASWLGVEVIEEKELRWSGR